MKYDTFTYTYYAGADKWGRVDERTHKKLSAEFEERIQKRFPGIHLHRTPDFYKTGVTYSGDSVQQMWNCTDVWCEICEISRRVLGRKPEPV